MGRHKAKYRVTSAGDLEVIETGRLIGVKTIEIEKRRNGEYVLINKDSEGFDHISCRRCCIDDSEHPLGEVPERIVHAPAAPAFARVTKSEQQVPVVGVQPGAFDRAPIEQVTDWMEQLHNVLGEALVLLGRKP